MKKQSNLKHELGQVFTPNEIVNLMLDTIHYDNIGVLGKLILEPSFGDGSFIFQIVTRWHNICLFCLYVTQSGLQYSQTKSKGVPNEEPHHTNCHSGTDSRAFCC